MVISKYFSDKYDLFLKNLSSDNNYAGDYCELAEGHINNRGGYITCDFIIRSDISLNESRITVSFFNKNDFINKYPNINSFYENFIDKIKIVIQ